MSRDTSPSSLYLELWKYYIDIVIQVSQETTGFSQTIVFYNEIVVEIFFLFKTLIFCLPNKDDIHICVDLNKTYYQKIK